MSASIKADRTGQVINRSDLPDVALDAMFPDEPVIWAQRGHGLRWQLIYTVPPVFYFSLVALMYALIAEANPVLGMTALLMLVVAVPLWAFGMLRPIFGPPYEHYVLTDKRLLHCTDLITRSTWALTYNTPLGADDLPITYITVWGRRERGWIVLRSELNRSHKWEFRLTNHPSSLVGIERPLEVAKLIKSTLNLPFEIEDRTK